MEAGSCLGGRLILKGILGGIEDEPIGPITSFTDFTSTVKSVDYTFECSHSELGAYPIRVIDPISQKKLIRTVPILLWKVLKDFQFSIKRIVIEILAEQIALGIRPERFDKRPSRI